MGLVFIISDLIGSEKVKWEKRDFLLSQLKGILNKANEGYSEDFVIQFQIIRGVDEFGAVLGGWSNSFRVMDYIYENMLPFVYRFVAVESEVITLESRDMNELDGAAAETIHKVSRLMERLKRAKASENNLFGLSRARSISGTGRHFALVNSLIEDCVWSTWRQKARWTKRELEVVRLYRELGNQRRVAEALGVTQANVSKILSRADFAFIKRREEKLSELFGFLDEAGRESEDE